MMKTVIIITLVAFNLMFSPPAVLASQSSFSPNECCFDFVTRPLPERKVVSHKYTDMLCPEAGVLFTMRNNAKICADPSEEWVKKILKALKRRNKEK